MRGILGMRYVVACNIYHGGLSDRERRGICDFIIISPNEKRQHHTVTAQYLIHHL